MTRIRRHLLLTILPILLCTAHAVDYDFIIVGAGAAGSVVAGALASKLDANVLLVEAGGDNTDPQVSSMFGYFNVAFNQFNYGFLHWGYETTEQTMEGGASLSNNYSPKKIDLPQGKVLGGSHSINAIGYVQAHASDFDAIAQLTGDVQWEFQNTKNLRNKLELGLDLVKFGMNQVGASEYVATANDVLGLPYNSNPLDGNQYGIGASYWTGKQGPNGGIRVSSYDAFVKPFLDKNGNGGTIDVVTYSYVEQLIFDDQDPTKVIGVSTFNTRSNLPFEFYAAKEVILSAGTYNTPKILMHSGIGPEAHLDSLGIATVVDLPGVGENLGDHYAVSTFWNRGTNLQESTPFLFQEPTFNVFGPEPQGPTSYHMELSGTFGSIVDLRAESRGTVRLQSSNPKDPPVIDPNVLSTTRDVEALVTGLKTILIPFFTSLVNQDLVTEGNFRLSQSDDELRDWVLQNVGTNHHPTGTCKIGASDDEYAVVDKDLKVFGTSNLRVVDASVFPSTPSANTVASTMTVAAVASKKIIQDN